MYRLTPAPVSKLVFWAGALTSTLVLACGGQGAMPLTQERPAAGAATVTDPNPEARISPDPVRKFEVDHTATLRFDPASFDVQPGETVEFVLTNSSGFLHTFTIAKPVDKSEILVDETIEGPGERRMVAVTFPTTPGQYYLFCRPHEFAGMVGTVTVK